MKETLPEQPSIDLVRLSNPQANGELRGTSRRPDANPQQPLSLSEEAEANLERNESKKTLQLAQKQKQKQKQIDEEGTSHDSHKHNHKSNSNTPNLHNGSCSNYLPAGGIPLHIPHVGTASNNTSVEVSAAPQIVQAARPGSFLEAKPPPLPSPSRRFSKDKEPEYTITTAGNNINSSNSNSIASTANNNNSSDDNTNNNHGGDNHGNDDNDSDSNGQNKDTGFKDKLSAFAISFLSTTKFVLFRSWLNVLLVFVPLGIAVGAAHNNLPPAIPFSFNAIAIVPLAGLLGFATESVAHRMGDSIGALLNVTFGNAVELIIFMYVQTRETLETSASERAFAKQPHHINRVGSHHVSLWPRMKLRIVQSSLLGSILANLLLILGMGFLLGGLRFREQIYNSTVTQMSACLLSLSVISLVLPTAFHASFSDRNLADRESLKISRGTSIVLLLVYGIYLLFQLKSHAYMYESTPQHIIDEEAEPGPAAAWLDSSSSDDSSSSSSSSDDSDHSRDTMKKRMRRVIRAGRRRRVSSVASVDTVEGSLSLAGPTRTPSFGTTTVGVDDDTTTSGVDEQTSSRHDLSRLAAMNLSEEAVDEEVSGRHKKHSRKRSLRRYRKSKRKTSHSTSEDHDTATEDGTIQESTENENANANAIANANTNGGLHGLVVDRGNSVYSGSTKFHDDFVMSGSLTHITDTDIANGETRRVDFAIPANGNATADELASSSRRAFTLRAMSLRPVAKNLTPSVFAQAPAAVPAVPGAHGAPGAPGAPTTATGPIPRVRYGIRRTNSLPDRLNQQNPYSIRPPGAMFPAQLPPDGVPKAVKSEHHEEDEEKFISRKAAVLMLLVTTGLVAACADFMVESINGLVASSNVNEVFIGLIILPIVGNAAEHVTAVMVAMKNKMDLAIGVAVGSSIQIALFMTPLVVILGWMMGREMTLYFTLFETVCLFVSAFIVNFLVLDGRSNYLEGALLLSAYIIISLIAFFYPDENEASAVGMGVA